MHLKHLNALILVLSFASLAAMVIPLYTAIAEVSAVDRRASYLQDLIRQREMLDMRDLRRILVEADQWMAKGQAPQEREFTELVDWFDKDLKELVAIVSSSPHAADYLPPVSQNWQSFLRELSAVKEALSVSDVAAAERHHALMDGFAVKLSAALNSTSAGMENPQLVTGELLERQIKLGKQIDQLLTYILVFFIVLAFGLAAYCQWGPTKFLDFINSKTMLMQKFLLVAATPIAFEIVFLTLLALMFYRGNDGIMRVQKDRALDYLHNQIYSQVATLAQNGKAAGSGLVEKMNAEIGQLRQLLKDRPQQMYSLSVIEESVRNIVSMQNDLEIAKKGSDSKAAESSEKLIKQNFERAILFAFYGRANVGQQEVLRVKLKVIETQVETAKRLQLVMILGILLNIALALSLAAYFNRAAGKRLAVISENIDRFAENKPLAREVGGADEIAQLDSFFHKMAQTVEAATRRERAVIDSATDIICSLDKEGNFAFVNPAVQEVWGYEPEKLNGKHVAELISGDEVGDTLHALEQLKENHGSQTFENRVRRAEGSLADMQWSCQWSDAEGLIFCVLQDISERKQLERLKQEFLAIVSHDLRTPLTSATAFLELLDVGVYCELTPKGERELEKDKLGLGVLRDLIVDLLDIERMEAGKLELDAVLLDLQQILTDASKVVRSYADLRSIKLEIEPCDTDMIGDPDRMKQVMVNLLAFAVKVSQRNRAVRVSIAETEELIEGRVRLDAANFSDSLGEHIFEPYRLNEFSDVTESGGRRLGLALCKAIIKRHRGWVGVETKPESVCTLWFRVPKEKAAAEAAVGK